MAMRDFGQNLSYDANGNLTGDGTRTYVWNARDQLVETRQGATVIPSYGCDAVGRRQSKTEGGTTAAYLYAGLDAGQETNGTSVNPILTGLGIDQRYARNDRSLTTRTSSRSSRTYFLTDALGSTRALTNASGQVVRRYSYSPYGETTQASGGFGNPYQYTGRDRDQSGIYYDRAPYYRPEIGRFISEDPIGLAGGISTSAYVGGNPVSYSDPLGLLRFGTRPLGPQGNKVSGPTATPSTLNNWHEHAFYDDGRNVGYFDDGIRSDSPSNLGRYTYGNTYYEDGLMSQVENYLRPSGRFTPKAPLWTRPVEGNYTLLGNNCQDFTKAMRDIYELWGGKTCNKPFVNGVCL